MDDEDDHDRNRQIMLDTSIILPIAVAGGITLLIVAFIYCCRRYQSTMSGNRDRGFLGRSYDSSIAENPVRQTNIRGRRLGQQTDNNASGNYVQQCLPWSPERGYYQRNWVTTGQQPQNSNIPSRNYSSTQSTTAIGQVSQCCKGYLSLYIFICLTCGYPKSTVFQLILIFLCLKRPEIFKN